MAQGLIKEILKGNLEGLDGEKIKVEDVEIVKGENYEVRMTPKVIEVYITNDEAAEKIIGRKVNVKNGYLVIAKSLVAKKLYVKLKTEECEFEAIAERGFVSARGNCPLPGVTEWSLM